MKRPGRPAACGVLTTVILALATHVAAQRKLLALDDIYDPGRRVSFSGAPAPQIARIDGTHYAAARGDRNAPTWIRVDAATGAETPLFDAGAMEAALATLPGIGADEARRAARSRDPI